MTVEQHGPITLHHGDCLDVLRDLPADSVDSIVTDPPYGLGFMGRAWDALPPGLEWAQECLRVLKPGGHLLAFGGTRTWHRLAVAVEDAGFEVRDSIAWLYGSGFPKSLDVAKAIDKGTGENRARQLEFTAWMRSTGITAQQINDATGTSMASHYLTDGQQPAIATADLFDRLRPLLPEVPERIERLVAERTGIEWTAYVNRPVVGQRTTGIGAGRGDVPYITDRNRDLTAAHTPEAQAWEGWGTALKPAFEPVVVARKPLAGTVAANVLAHGTGALNIDGCRVDAGSDKLGRPIQQGGSMRLDGFSTLEELRSAAERGEKCPNGRDARATLTRAERYNEANVGRVADEPAGGRWPANVVLDESQAAELDQQSGSSVSRVGKPRGADQGDGWRMTATGAEYDDQGGASRFFYVAKADSSERVRVDGTAHPTVKPLDLMRWLVRLVTPPGGTVLEPFAGSGTTVEACLLEGFACVAIEREADYLPLIRQRINRRRDPVAATRAARPVDDDPDLFDLLA